ncbi:hypothetical protein F7734_51115 [Scytonema sp. UIC 10036]|uniref:hypothetical protein n=1 Tax=Scytonema sp. UIC 10036 TaxID=2304196 RepID=UPI0012DA88CA|nr:hypothetical protein [Scytonema sp. UIC 10036]MUH00183.1 hypothetical protein [Scytonema sp. UIC 10036]
MKSIKFLTSACRYCRHYQPEGRRGGMCQQLGAPVRGDWKACSLALPPFAPSWETLEDVWSLPDAKIVLAPGLSTGAIATAEETVNSSPEQVKTHAREALKV